MANAAENWRIHDLFVRNRTSECLALVDRLLVESGGRAEYALYIKAVIRRNEGKFDEALELFQAALRLAPESIANLKQVGRSLFLLGQHARALATFDKARKLLEASARADRKNKLDWEVLYNMALCEVYLGEYERADKHLRSANAVLRMDKTYLLLARLALVRGDSPGAIAVLQEALEFSPASDELLELLGLELLRAGKSAEAVDVLGRLLSLNPKSSAALIGMGAVIQSSGDHDAALSKYRAAALVTPHSAQLWSNIGLAFLSKGKHVVAIACLKRAQALAPFEWGIAYNLGLAHLHTKQGASAFAFLNAAVSLNPDLAMGFAMLGVVLARMGDMDNACVAYERALQLASERRDAQPPQTAHLLPGIALNYAISLTSAGRADAAKPHLAAFEAALAAAGASGGSLDSSILETYQAFVAAPASPGGASGASPERT